VLFIGVAPVMTAQWIDSHAHLGDPAFADDREEVIARIREAGGLGVVCIG
jgi:Tat protein secretion system quality control protein TatD with DNase activity